MKAGKLKRSDLGKRATVSNGNGGFISGKLDSITLQWGSKHQLRLMISGFPVELNMDADIELIS